MISPIAITYRGIIFGFGWIFLIAIFLFDLFSQEHGWCGHLCPLGGFNAIVGKFSLVKVVHNVDRCINAQACLKTCPEMEVLDMIGKESRSVTQMECIKCGRCVEACPSEALTFSLVSMTKQIRDRHHLFAYFTRVCRLPSEDQAVVTECIRYPSA